MRLRALGGTTSRTAGAASRCGGRNAALLGTPAAWRLQQHWRARAWALLSPCRVVVVQPAASCHGQAAAGEVSWGVDQPRLCGTNHLRH